MAKIPTKLKKDAIFQAIFDVRFTCGELPEVVVGKLAGHTRWKGWAVQRLAVADIPAAIRQQDPSLQHQPLIELQEKSGVRLVRIGDRSLSCIALPPYPGWTAWEPELNAVIDLLHQSFDDFVATRFGLRYINSMTPEHFIKGTGDLRVSVSVADAPLAGPLMLQYRRNRDVDHAAMIRIAARDFVANPMPADLSAIIDVDVFTSEKYRSTDPKQAKAWLGSAHTVLKEEFFRLIPDEILEKLSEGGSE
jgi:uncharacterized protein (TIGR04255 family)